MSFAGNRLEEGQALESETSYQLLDEWLRIENEHAHPGFMLPSRAHVVAWCEKHPGTIVLSANALLWGPLLWAMYTG